MNKKQVKMKKCRYCLSTENLTIDHKHPLILGGTDDIKNLQCLCYSCNQIKSGIPHGQIQTLARWIYKINKMRAEKGKRPYAISKKNI